MRECARQISWVLFGSLLVFTVGACSSFYKQQIAFNRVFEEGEWQQAERLLRKRKRVERKGYRFVHYLDRGIVKRMLGDYEGSNHFLEKAYLFGEDYKRTVGDEVVTVLLNPNLALYYGEDHEHLIPLYYKALNYLQLHNMQAALVECRRLNVRLAALSSTHTSEKKYRRDAFVHMFMGFLYEAQGDINNAFIAYRNAYDVYTEDYVFFFGMSAPLQLQRDLLRTAAHLGFEEERLQYEKEMGMQTPAPLSPNYGEILIFWQKGLGPVKTQSVFEVAIVPGLGGGLYFRHAGLGIAIPILDIKQSSLTSLRDLRSIRVTFPTYMDRPSHFDAARLFDAGSQVSFFEQAEPLRAIARKCLKERMLFELSKSLLRVALKEIAEVQLRKENKWLGLVADVVGSVTEGCDTRGWQTLPADVYYARVPLPAGRQQLVLQVGHAGHFVTQDTLRIDVQPGKLYFHDFSSL